MDNQTIADIFYDIASLLEIKGDNPFKIKAYQRAARNIESLTQNLSSMDGPGSFTSIAGVGRDLADKIAEIIATGKSKKHQELKKEIPESVVAMLQIPGLGPKTIGHIYTKLGIDSLEALRDAAKSGKLRRLEGIKEKTEKNILEGIDFLNSAQARMILPQAQAAGREFLEVLESAPEADRVALAGSLRRGKDTVADIDILASSSAPKAILKRFKDLKQVRKVISCGGTKSSVISNSNIQIDLRVVDKTAFGAALLYFTGSDSFNVKLRHIAASRGYKLNEYGLFDKDDNCLAAGEEKDIFSALDMDYIEPCLREDEGEIEASLEHNLPDLVKAADIRGDLHVHSDYSDGALTMEEVAKIALARGYEYVAIADHSQSLHIAHGLDRRTVYKKIKEIEKLRKKFKKLKILCASEVDILSDGSLDYPEDILSEFDLVVAAIHSGFKQSRSQLTKRLVSACQNKHVDIIAHPRGRLWGTRPAYDVDFDAVLEAASDYNVALESNVSHHRFDLNGIDCRRAKQAGVKVAVNTDAHKLHQMELMDLGIAMPRRGWLAKSDVVNCMSYKELSKWLKR